MKQKQGIKEYGTAFWLPVLLILAVVPLVTIIHMYDNGIGKEAWASSSSTTYDFFLYYKSRFLMILGLAAAALIGYRFLNEDKGNFTTKNAWIHLLPVGVYGIFSLASALFAEHTEEAFFGGYEQFEGVLVLLVYCVTFLLVYGYVQTEKTVIMLLHALILGSLAVSILGVFQALKLDWIQSDWAYNLLTPELAGMGDFNISLNFERGMAYATLHNPNYVGSYVAVALPSTAALAFLDKKMLFRCLAAASCICQLIMLYASQSLTGFIGIAGVLLVVLVFLLPNARKHVIPSLCIAAACIAGIAVLFVAKPGLLDRLLHDDGGSSVYSIQSIQTKKDSFEIVTGSGKTILGKTNPQDIRNVTLTDPSGKKLAYEKGTDQVLTITEKGVEKIQFAPSIVRLNQENNTSLEGLQIRADGKTWNLVYKDGKLRYYNPLGKLDKLRKVDSFGFENNYDFATRRGYIWSRTFPMLPSAILFGIGQDNFVFEFPNHDYVGKINCAFDAQIITKPHNMYLQIWVQDGLFACLALVALYLMLLVSTLKNCWGSQKKTTMQKLSIAILCSASGYMIAGLANDATICVAPVFWILMALGFVLNGFIKRPD